MSRLFLAMILISAGCTSSPDESSPDAGDGTRTDTGLTCDEVDRAISDRVRELPTDCSADTDCTIECYDECGCCFSHRTVDDPELQAWREQDATCSLSACNNVPVCPWAGFGSLAPACIDSVCQAVPQPDCEMLANRSPELVVPFACTTDDDCEVRTDTNPCGCPEAWHVTTGEILARASERDCPVPEECLLIDCVPGDSARCDAGRCVLSD